MPTRTATATPDTTIALGGVIEFPAALLRTLAAGDAVKTGIKLAEDRVAVTVMEADGPVTYTLQFYAQRNALNADEQAKCDAVEAKQKATKAERTKAEADKHAEAEKRMFQLGQSSAFEAVRNIDVVNSAVATVRAAGR